MATSLRIDFCGHDAAKYAVEHFHYSRCMPSGPLVRFGVWENAKFIGVVLFGKGASPPLFKRLKTLFGVQQTEVAELVRVALTKHRTPVSRIVSIALKMLRKQCPGLKLVVSFADNDRGHHGGIYQAGNWIYCGIRNVGHRDGYLIHGRQVHCRSMPGLGVRNTLADARRLDPNAQPVIGTGKHQYFYVLSDDELRRKVEALKQPHPCRTTIGDPANADPCATSSGSEATAIQAVEGGATPTVALQINDRPQGSQTAPP